MGTRQLILVAGAVVLVAAAIGVGIWWQTRSVPPDPPIGSAVANFSLLDPPQPMPAHPFSDETGAERTFADFEGKVVLVNFWATWCAPCVAEMASLDRLQAALGGPDFQVLPISLDIEGASEVVPFYEQHGLEHLPIALNPKGEIGAAVSLQGLPTTILVGRDGMAIGILLGAAEWDSPDAMELISWILARDE